MHWCGLPREAGQSVQTYFSLPLAPPTGNKEKYGWLARLNSTMSDIMISWSELGGPGDQLQYHALEPRLLLVRKVATKVVRMRSDRGSRCTDKDRSKETED